MKWCRRFISPMLFTIVVTLRIENVGLTTAYWHDAHTSAVITIKAATIGNRCFR